MDQEEKQHHFSASLDVQMQFQKQNQLAVNRVTFKRRIRSIKATVTQLPARIN